MVDQILDHHLRTVQTTGSHIFCQHRVADVKGNDGLYTRTLLTIDLGAELRTGYHDDKQRQRGEQQGEFDQRTETRHVRHELAHQVTVAKLAQTSFLLTDQQKAQYQQKGYQRQCI